MCSACGWAHIKIMCVSAQTGTYLVSVILATKAKNLGDCIDSSMQYYCTA